MELSIMKVILILFVTILRVNARLARCSSDEDCAGKDERCLKHGVCQFSYPGRRNCHFNKYACNENEECVNNHGHGCLGSMEDRC